MNDYVRHYGPSCCSCGAECSGFGHCDDCGGVLCFGCANFERPLGDPRGRGRCVCDDCQWKRGQRG